MASKTEKILRKELKILRICFIIVVLCVWFMIYVFLGILYFNQMYHNDNVSVSFEEDGNFTYQEKEYFYKILNDVKPEYLESTKGIHVLMENDKRKYLGKNKWGEIWVEYNDDPVFLKMVLCHELLHNINLIDKNATEVIIKDLSAEGVCYIYEDDGN